MGGLKKAFKKVVGHVFGGGGSDGGTVEISAPAASPTDEVITADNTEVNTTTSDGKDMSNY